MYFLRFSYLILLGGVVVFHPALFRDHKTLERKGFIFPHLNGDLGALANARLGTEYRHKAAEHGGVDQIFALGQFPLLGDLVGRRQRRVRFDLAIVKNLFAILEGHGIAKPRHLRDDLFHLILFGGGKILRIGTGIGQIALFVKPLDRKSVV